MKHLCLVSLLIIAMTQALPAQEVLRGHLFFGSGEYDLTAQHERLLGMWLDSLQQLDWQGLTIEAHTDTFGSDAYNRRLSEQRASSVFSFLLTHDIDSSLVHVEYFGEAYADARDQETEDQGKFSRRVDLVATLPKEADAVDLAALYRQLKGGYQYIRASMREDTTVCTEGGAILCLRKESFLRPAGGVYRGPIELRIQEASNLGARLRNNLSLPADQLRETVGMLEIRARGSSGALLMNPKVPITVMLPTDSVRDSMQVSVARERAGETLTWSDLRRPELRSDAFDLTPHQGRDFQAHWAIGQHYEPYDYSWSKRTQLKLRKLFTGRVYQKGHWVADTPSVFRQQFEQEFGGFSCVMLAKTPKPQRIYYTFNLPSFGWISCDRPFKPDSERIDFVVKLPSRAAQTDIKLVLKESQSILSGTRTRGQIVFSNVPLGQRAQLVGLRVDGQNSGLAVEETVITPGVKSAPTFELMPLGSLKQRLATW